MLTALAHSAAMLTALVHSAAMLKAARAVAAAVAAADGCSSNEAMKAATPSNGRSRLALAGGTYGKGGRGEKASRMSGGYSKRGVDEYAGRKRFPAWGPGAMLLVVW